MSIDLNELATAISQLTLRFRVRRRTAADWITNNEVLLSAEFGYESDTGKMKIGDGITPWSGLSYWSGGGTELSSKNAGVGIDISMFEPTDGSDPYLLIKNTGVVNLVAGDGISLVVQPVPGTSEDPYWANVSMLLHMDGDDTQIHTYDSSSNGLAVVTSSGAALSTAVKKWGLSGGLIPQAGGHWSVADNAVFAMGAGDWTIEGWFFPKPFSVTSGGTTTDYEAIITFGKFANLGTSGTAALGVVMSDFLDLYLIDNTGTAHHFRFYDFVVPNDGSYDPAHPTYTAQNPTPHTNNAWNHVVIERIGTKVYAYCNGWQMGYNSEQSSVVGAAGYPTARGGYDIGTVALNDMASPFILGGGATGSLAHQFYGGIDDFRVTKGVGRYTGASFDLPTAQFWSTDAPVEMETVITATGGGSGGATYYSNTIDIPPTTPDTWDDEFNGSVLDSAWTLVNPTSGGATCHVTVSNGSVYLQDDTPISGQIRLLAKNPPSGDFSIAAKLRMHGSMTYNNIGFGLYNSAGPSNWIYRFVSRTDNFPLMTPGWFTFSNPNGATSPSESNGPQAWPETVYIRIDKVSGTIKFYISPTGRYWQYVWNFSVPTFDKIVLMYANYATHSDPQASTLECEWVRRLA